VQAVPAELEKSQASPTVYKRRRKVAIFIFLALLALGYYFWANTFSGKLALIQEATASEITRGKLFGPFWAKGFARNSYSYEINLPLSPQVFEIKVELLDEHLRVIHPQSDFLLSGQAGLGPGKDYKRKSYFKLRTGGSYFIRFTQVNGTYPQTDASADSAPVMRIVVRTDIIDGWRLWLPIVIVIAFALAAIIII